MADDLVSLQVKQSGPVAEVTLLGPGKGNAMGPDFWRELPIVFRELDADRDTNVLLVLDNAEHIPNGVTAVTRVLLGRYPGVHVLVTARRSLTERLGVNHEIRPLSVRTRPGSMLAASSPAACQYYYSHLGLLIDLVVKALSAVLPGKAAAASYGDSMIVQFTGVDPRSGKFYVSQEATVGGWGAWEGGDGETCLINNVNGSLRDMPIEVLETLFPVR
ncbi:hydantoinase B/oxoprolinase family protein, partial [Kibdelosporangium lantanae]